MSGGKKQQKNRRDSVKNWRFQVLPPEHSRTQFTISVSVPGTCRRSERLTIHPEVATESNPQTPYSMVGTARKITVEVPAELLETGLQLVASSRTYARLRGD